MQHRPNIDENNLIFHYVKGVRETNGTNKQEIKTIIDTLKTYLVKYKNESIKPTIGIISPYSKQVSLLEKTIFELGINDELKSFDLLIGSPYHFQGEERDIILLSFVVGQGDQRAASYLNKEDMFNVAITRSRQIQHVFHCVVPAELPPKNLFRKFLEFNHKKSNDIIQNKYICNFQEALSQELTHSQSKY